jgi:tetratricopeptide (TPR) repeat protein
MKNKLDSFRQDDVDLIRKNMLYSNLGLAKIENSVEKEQQKLLILEEKAKLKKEMFEKGYINLMKEIENNSAGGFIKSDNDIDLIPIDKFTMDENTKNLINNIDFWKNYIENPSPLKYLFRYSNQMLLFLYEISSNFYENKEYPEAISSYNFLTMLKPDISSFWIALGLALEDNNELLEGIQAFEKGAESSPSVFTPYFGIIRCSEKLQDFTKASELLLKACDNKALENEAKEALEYISNVSR